MAYVSISKELVRDVELRLSTMSRAEIATLPTYEKVAADIATNQEVKELINASLWGDMADLEPRLAPFSVLTRLDLHIQWPHSSGDRNYDKEIQVANWPLPCFRRPSNSYAHYYDWKVSADAHPLFQQVREIYEQQTECSERWNKVTVHVTDFVKKCKSLNEAIKLWPDVVRYIPKEYIDRVERKVEKSASTESGAAAALKAMDLDTINSSTVLARMAGVQL